MGAWYERSALSSHLREVAIEHFGIDTAALVLDATNLFTPISFSPMFHWTDDKIRVHVFYCVDALGLAEYMPGGGNTPKT